jgi:hypothetical protein
MEMSQHQQSNLHDVVGQGVKNLGNMFFSKDQFDQKIINSLSKVYISGKGIETQIDRIRKTAHSISNDTDSLLKKHNLCRKCILSCTSFLRQGRDRFNKIKQRKRVRGHIFNCYGYYLPFLMQQKKRM